LKQSKRKRVTLQQVAEHAGVSRATASLIVRNSPSVSEKTRKKVLASMKELGYVYDRIAANLRSQTSSTIGVIITDISNTFFTELLIGVHEELEKDGYTVFLGTTFDSDNRQDQLLSTMLEHRVGGIILCPVAGTSEDTIRKIQHLDVPSVLAVRELPEVESDYVGVDYRLGVQKAVQHLLEQGHKRIAFLGGTTGSTTWKERMEGYRLALKNAGISIDEELVIPSGPTRSGGVEAARQVLDISEPPTAVFCFSDLVAFGVMQGLKEKGIVPGEDIAVVGFDNVMESSVCHPTLTTVSSFARQIGKDAARCLHNQIVDKKEHHHRIILTPQLVVRESSSKKRSS
jgi:LacI family transcriptional regulator